MKRDGAYKPIERSYTKSSPLLYNKEFHFWSRRYLWNRDDFSYKKLLKLKKKQIGSSDLERKMLLEGLVKKEYSKTDDMNAKDIRIRYALKYKRIKGFNLALFRGLFSEIVYGESLKRVLREVLPNEEVIKLKESLLGDPNALMHLQPIVLIFSTM